MIIELRSDQEPVVVGVEDLKRLHAVAIGSGPFLYGKLCSPATPDHVWLDIALLRATASSQVGSGLRRALR